MNANKSKIKLNALCNKYENGGLKNVDILSEIISLQYFWIKRLYDNSSHPCKIIPSYLIDPYLWNFLSSNQVSICQLIENVFPYTINKHIRNGVEIYLHFLIFSGFLHLKLFGKRNV